MSEKLVWVCDGCDAEQVMAPGRKYDWKKVTAAIEGLSGYPTCRPEPAEPLRWNLCPTCAERFYQSMYPTRWDRSSAKAP